MDLFKGQMDDVEYIYGISMNDFLNIVKDFLDYTAYQLDSIHSSVLGQMEFLPVGLYLQRSYGLMGYEWNMNETLG